MTEPVPDLDISGSFDLDKWINGTCGMTRTAKIYQRGDLFARFDELERELEVAKKIPKANRGVGDRAPEQLERELESLAEELNASAITVHVQDRTEERRRKVRDRLKKQGIATEKGEDDRETIGLHMLADSIIKVETADGRIVELPDGFPPDKLRKLKDGVGDAALLDVWQAYYKVTSEAPNVAAPLSRSSSSNHGGIT